MSINLAEKRKKRFSDFAVEPRPLAGEKIKIDAILNQEVEILACNFGTTRYSKNKTGKYLTLQIRINDDVRVLFTGSDVLIKQMTKYEPELPFLAVIVQINRYYTFS